MSRRISRVRPANRNEPSNLLHRLRKRGSPQASNLNLGGRNSSEAIALDELEHEDVGQATLNDIVS
jgi:hypothetical protein